MGAVEVSEEEVEVDGRGRNLNDSLLATHNSSEFTDQYRDERTFNSTFPH